ncbi:MAG: tRNA 2-thiouridine(34) synthase MnmA [Chloroflexi bacterium]|nr:tRNA 2-thiouridine(34) synthase MnmA [Chloroflexota bacterium]MCY3937463.1 tRNA 2-thiouridine(34) synthase MnmA [Chloroflexota bacterium]
MSAGAGRRVAVAMSGGVDSSVAAALLVERGFDVFGITLDIWPDQSEGPGSRNCCSPESRDDARQVAEILGIPHEVVDLKDLFARSVIENFAGSYFEGLTPNPCIDCNRYIKFDALEDIAREAGAGAVATGHYARIDENGPDGRRRLLRGRDKTKDQSYVLYVLTQAQLDKAMFPLGGLSKQAVRTKAAELGLPVADKPESMDICFVAGNYRSFARSWAGRTGRKGPIYDIAGDLLGTHSGIENYTVGQRRGLGIAIGEPAYVSHIDVEQNSITVGPRDALSRNEFQVDDVNLVSVERVTTGTKAGVKVRSRMPELPARLFPNGDAGLTVVTDEPAWAVAPGQAAVFYDGDVVLGGGRVSRSARPLEEPVAALTGSHPSGV